MMKNIYILFLLLLATPVLATQVVLTSDDLPYTASSYDTITISGTHITSVTNGIKLEGGVHDIVIDGDPDDDGNKDTLTYNTGGESGNFGIRCYYSSGYGYIYNLTVKNIVINQYDHTEDSTGSSSPGISMTGTHDALFENVDVNVYSRDAMCVYNYSAIGNFRVRFVGGNYNNHAVQNTNRCQFYAAAMNIGTAHSDSGRVPYDTSEYNYYLRDVNVTSHGPGIVVRSKSIIVACTVSCDARNTFWDGADWGEQGYENEEGAILGTCSGTANSYGIILSGGIPGCRIDSNVVTSGTDFGGGRGIMVENTKGLPEAWVQLTGNKVDVHEGPDKAYADGANYEGRALTFRDLDGGTCRYIHVFDNEFKGTAKNIDLETVALDSMVAYTSSQSTFKLQSGYGGKGSLDADGCHFIIEDNLFTAYSIDDSCFSVPLKIYANDMDSTVIFRNNIYETDVYMVYYRAGGNTVLQNPTFKRLSPNYSDTTFFWNQPGLDWSSSGHVVENPTYDGADSSVAFWSSNQGVNDITFRKPIKVYVQGSDSKLVSGANVWAEDNYGIVRDSGITFDNGFLKFTLPYRYESRTETDSTGYNDYKFIAEKSSDRDTVEMTVSWQSDDTVTITLAATGSNTGTDSLGLAELTFITRDRHDYSGDYDSVLVKFDVSTVESGVTLVYATDVSSTDSTTFVDLTNLSGGENVCEYALGSVDSVSFYVKDSVNGIAPDYNPQIPEPGYIKLSWYTKLGDKYSQQQNKLYYSEPGNPIKPYNIYFVNDSTQWNVSGDTDRVLLCVVTSAKTGDSLPEQLGMGLAASADNYPDTTSDSWRLVDYTPDSTYYEWFNIVDSGCFSVRALARSYNSNYLPNYGEHNRVYDTLCQPFTGPVSVEVDSFYCDFNGEKDSAQLTIVTDETTSDYIYWVTSDTGYITDISFANDSIAYVNDTTFVVFDTLTGEETYTIYASVWIKNEGSPSNGRFDSLKVYGPELKDVAITIIGGENSAPVIGAKVTAVDTYINDTLKTFTTTNGQLWYEFYYGYTTFYIDTFVVDDTTGTINADTTTLTLSIDGYEGNGFVPINLDNYVSGGYSDSDIEWTVAGETNLEVTISDRIASIFVPPPDTSVVEIFSQGDTGSTQESSLTSGQAYGSHLTITETGGPWTIDSAFVRLNIVDKSSSQDSFKVWIWNDYTSDSTINDTSLWATCFGFEGSIIDTNLIFTFTWDGTIYSDSSYYFHIAAQQYTGSGYPDIVLDDTSSAVPDYLYKAGVTVETEIPSEYNTWPQTGTGRKMIFGLYGTSVESPWTGSEEITFIAMSPDSTYDSTQTTFTVTLVNEAPVVSGIPDSTVTGPAEFGDYNLLNYITDSNHDIRTKILWTILNNDSITVNITDDTLASFSYPEGWTGSESIIFKATDAGFLTDVDTAVFTVE